MKLLVVFLGLVAIRNQLLGAVPTVRLIKNRVYDGLIFSRKIKYTNDTITGMPKNENSNKTHELSLDVLMVADFSTYQAFLEMSDGNPGSAQHYLITYLTAIFEQTKMIYDKINFRNQTLKFAFAGTFIALREEDCPLWQSWEDEALRDVDNTTTYFDNSTDLEGSRNHFVDHTLDDLEDSNSTEMSLRIDSKMAIDKFTIWIKQYSEFLPRHEHAVLVTKFDLISLNGHSATQGMAYVGNICQLGESSSVVEDIGASLTALIAAHEIGHSLGAVHDGAQEASDCDSNDNYLLAAAVSGSSDRQAFLNSRTMSNCSVTSILENLKKPSASCIKKWRSEITAISSFEKKPGELISLMQQCQIAFGPTFGNCLNTGYYHGNSICSRIWCSDRKDPKNDVCQTLNYFPAFDGTECGYNMWCIDGECVRNPKKWMDCKDLNAKTCSRYSTSKLKHFCKSQDFREICCRTCAKKGKVTSK